MNYHKIEVDDQLFQLLRDHAEPFVDTPNTVLRRLLLDDKNSGALEGNNEEEIKSRSILIPCFPKSTPTALVHILEVIWLVKKREYERTEATNLVAQRRKIAPQTVIDKYCRQLSKRAYEIDRLLEHDSLDEFENLLAKNFPNHLDTMRRFFQSFHVKQVSAEPTPPTPAPRPIPLSTKHITIPTGSKVEIQVNRIYTPKKYSLIPVRNEIRPFFPGYKVPFVLETDIGEIETQVTSAPQGTQIGNPDAGNYIAGGLKPWYKQHYSLSDGSILIIEAIEKDKRYRLSIKGTQ